MNPLLLDLPMPIVTERLVIRPLQPGEGHKVFEAIEESRDLFRRWMSWVDQVKSPHDSEGTVREFYASFIQREKLTVGLFVQETLIGMSGFNEIDWRVPSGAIGYWCRTSAQGRGFVREAVAALTVYAFKTMGLKRVTLLCDDANHRSKGIPENLGFILETRALGLIENCQDDSLAMGCQYVRFDADGL